MKNMIVGDKINIGMNEQGAYVSSIKRDGYVLVNEVDWDAIMSFIDDKLQNHQ